MKNLLRKVLLAAVLIVASVCVIAAETAVKPVKYVFLFIGDGMSMPQRITADKFNQALGNTKLFINSMPHQAVTTTNSANAFITDSAASGTAIACGEKTRNGTIGMDVTRKRNLESIAKVAHKSGRKVGIITSITINHATPSSFYANNPSRSNYYNIAQDLVKSNFDYFGGGGAAAYNDKKAPGYAGSVYDLARKNGYQVAFGRKEIAALPVGKGKLWAVGAEGPLPYAIDRTENDMRLEEFVQQAIKHLDNEKGFFLMVEGGRIDTVCHANDAGTSLREVIDFDKAVKCAYDFALKHPAETLIVVTGDHETGGLSLGFANTGYKSQLENLELQKCSIDSLTAQIQALGKAKENVVFEDIVPLINKNFSMYLPDGKLPTTKHLVLTKSEVAKLKKAFERQFPKGKLGKGRPLAVEIIRCFNTKSSLAWSTGGHTAMPVLTTAYGKNASVFSNLIDNTDIAKILKQAVR